MEWNKQSLRGWLTIVCTGVVLFCALQNLRALAGAAGALAGIFAPFFLGGSIAFVLNVPMRAIERRLLAGKQRGRRPAALLLALAAVIGVLTLAGAVIAPGVKEAVLSIAEQLPDAFARLEQWTLELQAYLPQIEAFIIDLDIDWQTVSRSITGLVKNWGASLMSSGGGLIGGVVSGVTTFVIGLIFSFYLLLQKERLARQGRQVLYALLPEKRADRALEVLRLANRTFSSFLSGQCLEACILGTLFVVAMTIFRLPYALLVGVLIALTALIPIVGAFIGCVVGALLIAVTSPVKALLFVVLFLVLQQVEGNLIYPHVVGNSVGLPSIWVLAAVTVGGGLMGVVGMLVFIPLCSVVYALFREYVLGRLAEKRVPEEKWREP